MISDEYREMIFDKVVALLSGTSDDLDHAASVFEIDTDEVEEIMREAEYQQYESCETWVECHEIIEPDNSDDSVENTATTCSSCDTGDD